MHRFNRTQQDALLPHVEEGLLVLVGATTENPFFSLTAPAAVAVDAVPARAARPRRPPRAPASARSTTPSGASATTRSRIDDDALDHLADRSEGDARHALTSLEVAHVARRASRAATAITLEDAEAALALRALRYGDDEHYDVVSAFIKSIRGSDPDAGLYWLARMLEAGEDAALHRAPARDPRVRGRRAWPTRQALLVADAAARAVEFVGLPEAQLNLAHAVVHLAHRAEVEHGDHRRSAPRSRTCASARRVRCPTHLRDAHYPGARRSVTGRATCILTTRPSGWVPQEYRPPEVAGRVYYQPGSEGAEAGLAERLERRRARTDSDRER